VPVPCCVVRYGHDLDTTTTPVEGTLLWTIGTWLLRCCVVCMWPTAPQRAVVLRFGSVSVDDRVCRCATVRCGACSVAGSRITRAAKRRRAEANFIGAGPILDQVRTCCAVAPLFTFSVTVRCHVDILICVRVRACVCGSGLPPATRCRLPTSHSASALDLLLKAHLLVVRAG